MAEPGKQQMGDGRDNYGQAAKETSKAAKNIGKGIKPSHEHSINYSFIHSSIHSLTHPLVHPSIHSFTIIHTDLPPTAHHEYPKWSYPSPIPQPAAF